MKLRRFALAAMALLTSACYDFHIVGPEDPAPLKSPATVSVSVLYSRPPQCVNTGSSCAGPVRFTASWMARGSSVDLVQTSANIWTATVPDVPVNFPTGDPHHVYAVDPYLADSPTEGISADRLTVGGERIVRIENPGGTREQGLILIDANGKGRTPQ